MTKGDAFTLLNLAFTFAGFWILSREAKQRKLEGYRGYNGQSRLENINITRKQKFKKGRKVIPFKKR